MSGAMHLPPFRHWTLAHTGSRHVSPVHSRGHVHFTVPDGFVQFPPLPQVTSHTGVVQLGSNQPGLQKQVSGARQTPFTQPCTHSACAHVGPVYPGLHAHVLLPMQIWLLQTSRDT